MHIRPVHLLIVGSIVMLLGAGTPYVVKALQKPVLHLGYCPTMAVHLDRLGGDPVHVLYPSAADAFRALDSGIVDAVLVGRPAMQQELSEPFVVALRGGATLVGAQKRMVPVAELRTATMHTALPDSVVEEYVPGATGVVRHASTAEAIAFGLTDMVLLDWQDYTEEYALVIPMRSPTVKEERFRIPMVYAYEQRVFSRLGLRVT